MASMQMHKQCLDIYKSGSEVIAILMEQNEKLKEALVSSGQSDAVNSIYNSNVHYKVSHYLETKS